MWGSLCMCKGDIPRCFCGETGPGCRHSLLSLWLEILLLYILPSQDIYTELKQLYTNGLSQQGEYGCSSSEELAALRLTTEQSLNGSNVGGLSGCSEDDLDCLSWCLCPQACGWCFYWGWVGGKWTEQGEVYFELSASSQSSKCDCYL